MNKKLIKSVGKCVVALTLVCVIALLACGCGKGKAEVYKQGDIVKIPIEVTENPGMLVAKVVLNYDSSVLDYLECEDGFFSGTQATAVDGKLTCLSMAEGITDITEKGTAFTVVFKVKADAKAGEYLLSLDDTCEYASADEKFVTPKVSITEKIKIE